MLAGPADLPAKTQSCELRAARGRIRQLEQELEIVKRASKWLSEEERVDPKGRTR